MDTTDIRYTILSLALKNANLIDIYMLLRNEDKRSINYAVKSMIAERLITANKIVSDEYTKCIDWAKRDKRIKNIEKYCLKLYPAKIKLSITPAGIAELIRLRMHHMKQFIDDMLDICENIAREFKQYLQEKCLFVYNFTRDKCILFCELENPELFASIEKFKRYKELPLVIAYEPKHH